MSGQERPGNTCLSVINLLKIMQRIKFFLLEIAIIENLEIYEWQGNIRTGPGHILPALTMDVAKSP